MVSASKLDLSTIRLFVFDFDGTLVQSNAIKRSLFYELTADIAGSAALLDALLRAEPPLDRHGIFRALADKVPGLDPQALTTAYTAACEARIAAAPEVPGAFTLLSALRNAGRFCVVNSATPEAALRSLVSRMPMGPLLQAVYGRPAGKVENIGRAMDLAGATPERTVVIGDGEADRQAALAAGCGFIGVKSDNNDFQEPPTLLLRDLRELIAACSLKRRAEG